MFIFPFLNFLIISSYSEPSALDWFPWKKTPKHATITNLDPLLKQDLSVTNDCIVYIKQNVSTKKQHMDTTK